MGVSWTKEQQKVIDTRNCNLLVSAAAGSGKTAVLVERILKRITDPHHPADIDRLLIVTFTRAAAGEMKERIRAAIEKQLEENQEDEHLQRQASLIHHAQITTIDSFCSYVVKNYFHLIDLDPSFRMGEEGEMRLMQADAADRVLEEAYAREDNADFSDFVDCFGGGKSDTRIADYMIRLYEFSMSYPYPEEWLETCRKAYEIQGTEELLQAPWFQAVKREAKRQIQEAAQLLTQAEQLSGEADGPAFYLELLGMEKYSVQAVCAQEDFFSWKERLDALEFKRLPPGKKAEKELVSETKQELVKSLRNEAKDLIKDIKARYFAQTAEEMTETLKKAAKPVGVLVDLTLAFQKAYQAKKKEKNVLDFADLEHYALKILVDHSDGEDKRTDAARELASRFTEIMIDEYQDSNLVQEKLLTAVSQMEEGNNNIFMVGDVKQSIYRFRLARPDLFMEKFRSYPAKEGGKTLRIDLHRNFRSRKEVLDGVNYLFYQLMGDDLGGVEYDEDAALYPQLAFPQKEQESLTPADELLLLEEDEEIWQEQETSQTSRELEARMAALRIREIMEEEQVLDKETGRYRKPRFSDFTLLLRTVSGWSETFKKVLNASGIPANVTTKTGYFSASEVAAVLDYLQILDNPFQDIPLAGAMKSMPGGFSLEELAQIGEIGKEEETHYLYESLLAAEKREGSLGVKVRGFLKTYRDLRKLVPYTPMHELLWAFYDATGFLVYQQAFVTGEQRKANLLMLLEKARDYESTSYRGLFHFVRYIENLKKYQMDFGEASVLSENDDSVKIMSIHSSKGLEFPIVFVCGMGKQINLQDARDSIVLHPDLGIGAACVDEKLRIRTKTLLQKAVQQEITLESLGEELRILYVALTRAKERLVLTGTVSGLEKKLAGWGLLKKQEKKRLPYGLRSKGKTYLDWVLAALSRHKAMKPLYEACGLEVNALNPLYEGTAEFSVRKLSPGELALGEAQTRTEEKRKQEELLNWDTENVYNREIRRELEESFSYEYPFAHLARIPAKMTVSEVKRRLAQKDEESLEVYGEERNLYGERKRLHGEEQNLYEQDLNLHGRYPQADAEEKQESRPAQMGEREEPPLEAYVPRFMREEEEELQGAQRGTAYHRVLESLDFSRTDSSEDIARQIRELTDQGKITPQMARAVSPTVLYRLAGGHLGRRMRSAWERGELYREQPFVIEVRAEEVSREFQSQEGILIQGIIDAYFLEGDAWVLVDYKTDRVSPRNPRELTQKYKIQLDYYAQALYRMTGKRVKEAYIYSTYLGREIPAE